MADEWWWTQSGQPWMVKFRRARHHLEQLRRASLGYRLHRYAHVEVEQTEVSGRWAYVLEVDELPPVEIATLLGDLVYNLRSGLDKLAAGLAEWNQREPLTEAQARATAFPVFDTEAAFADWARKTWGLYSASAILALRALQPFADPADLVDVEPAGVDSADAVAARTAVGLLDDLWNIDKYRHLVVANQFDVNADWLPGQAGWNYEPGEGVAGNGTALFYLTGDGDPPDVAGSFNLALVDDRYTSPPLVICIEHIGKLARTHCYCVDRAAPNVAKLARTLCDDVDRVPPIVARIWGHHGGR